MLPFLSLLGIFLSVILFLFNSRKYKASVYLSLFFLFISLYGFYQYVLLYSKSVTLVSYFLLNLSVIGSPLYLIGPMLFWYVRSVLTDNTKLKKSDLWHFLPMVIYFIAALPNTFVPWHEKVELARKVVANQEFIMGYKATILNKYIPAVAIYLFRLILILGYAIWSFVLFINFIIKGKSQSVMSKQHFMRKWIFILLGSLFVLVISQIFLVVRSFEMHFSDMFFTFNILRIISEAGLICLLISPFLFPSILYGLPRLPEFIAGLEHEQSDTDPSNKNDEKKIGSYENEYLNEIALKIETCMKEKQPFLEPGFNLTYLSVMIEIPVHHLAYYFREVKKERFIDYRNRWRVDYAKSLIREGKTSEFTLEAIGLTSGFPNRNAFRNALKKFEGKSPANFT
jgi:AraC-like DNA-binding protein